MKDSAVSTPRRALLQTVLALVLACVSVPVAAAREPAFAENFALRFASYRIEKADTNIAVLDRSRIGTSVDFADDLGGDETETIPRLDLYYRFSERHRIDLASYRFERDGRKRLEISIDWDNVNYSAGETVISAISFELLKLGYSYSFYHSSTVELGFTAGLNITGYELKYELVDGSEADRSEANAPLPMLGLRMSYALTPRWSLHYLSDTFFIEVGDEFEGAFLGHELDLRYRAGKNLLLGAGFARLSIDLEANDEDWRGRITDSHRGFLFYLGFQL